MTAHLPLAVTYLLDDAGIWGGTKVVLEQANALAGRGHTVTVVCKGPRPDWMGVHCRFLRVPGFNACTIPPSDVVVAPYSTTVAAAIEAARGQVLHYCQGFEWTFPHNTADHPAILDVYAQPVPAMVVSPHLGEELAARFGRPSQVVSPPYSRVFSPRWRLGPRRRPRIVVMGPYEIVWKGAHTALLAVRRLRETGMQCILTRISQFPASDAERAVLEADHYHVGITPARVAALLRRADLVLQPSWEQEGFGLPVLEAAASGVPVVASDIPTFRAWTEGAVELAPRDDADAYALKARRLLGDARAWRERRRAGLTLASHHTQEVMAGHAEAALRWAASGEWRRAG
jgi:glycosyltransferase involved in cell wall biosynthesis